jgi:hypothetical protein
MIVGAARCPGSPVVVIGHRLLNSYLLFSTVRSVMTVWGSGTMDTGGEESS